MPETTSGNVIRARTPGHPLTSLAAFSSSGLTVRRKVIVRSIAMVMKGGGEHQNATEEPKERRGIARDQATGKTPPKIPVRPLGHPSDGEDIGRNEKRRSESKRKDAAQGRSVLPSRTPKGTPTALKGSPSRRRAAGCDSSAKQDDRLRQAARGRLEAETAVGDQRLLEHRGDGRSPTAARTSVAATRTRRSVTIPNSTQRFKKGWIAWSLAAISA